MLLPPIFLSSNQAFVVSYNKCEDVTYYFIISLAIEISFVLNGAFSMLYSQIFCVS